MDNFFICKLIIAIIILLLVMVEVWGLPFKELGCFWLFFSLFWFLNLRFSLKFAIFFVLFNVFSIFSYIKLFLCLEMLIKGKRSCFELNKGFNFSLSCFSFELVIYHDFSLVEVPMMRNKHSNIRRYSILWSIIVSLFISIERERKWMFLFFFLYTLLQWSLMCLKCCLHSQ